MSSSSKRVMIVEDEIMLQDVYKMVLEIKGYEVTVANNGQEALTKLQQAQPDVILLDMLMPIMDGKQFMHTMDPCYHETTKVIVYSNLSDSAVETEMLELGAKRFILKSSMTPADLVIMIETI